MHTIQLSEAKSHLSEYGRQAEEGVTTIVTKHHRPVFSIAPLSAVGQPTTKILGIVKGKIHMSEDFNRTPESVIADFEGRS